MFNLLVDIVLLWLFAIDWNERKLAVVVVGVAVVAGAPDADCDDDNSNMDLIKKFFDDDRLECAHEDHR